MKETVLKPKTLKSEELVKIIISENNIECSTINYDEIFYQKMKYYRFEWQEQSRKWKKSCHIEHIKDRAAEIIKVLLLAGFAVYTCNHEVIYKVANNTFRPEPTRLIDICDISKYENYLVVSWLRQDLYSCVRHNLYGSKYLKKNRSIVVPIYFHQEIYDFAEEYEFLITEKAKEKIEEGKTNVFVLFNIESPEEAKTTIFHQPDKLTPQPNEINDSLKE